MPHPPTPPPWMALYDLWVRLLLQRAGQPLWSVSVPTARPRDRLLEPVLLGSLPRSRLEFFTVLRFLPVLPLHRVPTLSEDPRSVPPTS